MIPSLNFEDHPPPVEAPDTCPKRVFLPVSEPGSTHGFSFVIAFLPFFLVALSSCSNQPAGLTPALASADSLLQAAVADERIPGAVLLIAQQGHTHHEKAYGAAQLFDYGGKRMNAPPPMTTAHRFDLASLTKVFATTFGLMLLVDQGTVDLDAPVFTYLPAFRGPAKDSVTVRHLLTHSAGLYPWKPLYYHARTPGFLVLLIAQQGHTHHEKAYGAAQLFDYGGKRMNAPPPMTTAHRFDLASLTKVFATTFGLMLLVDQGTVDLDAPVFTYLPAFRGPAKDSVTVRHLLTHSAGLYPWKPLYYHARTPQETYAYISQLPLGYLVGKERHYSDLGFMLLGYLIEAVSGQSLDAFLSNTVYDPLGLKKTTFNPPPSGPPFAATSHGNPFEKRMVADDSFGYLCDEEPDAFQGWRTYVVAGEVNDGNAFHAHGGLAGHAGLFSTAADLQVMLDLLLNKGVYAGRRLLSEDVIETFLTKNRFGHGLGWAMSTDVIPVDDLPAGSFVKNVSITAALPVMPASSPRQQTCK